MRAVQYVHAHELHGAITGETTRWRTVCQQMKDPEGVARTIKLVTRVTGEVEAEVLVVV